MVSDFSSTMNQMEAQIAKLEQKRVVGQPGLSDVSFSTTGVPIVEERLDWTESDGWESYTKITVATVDGTGAKYSAPYAMPAAHMHGRMCVLTGMVRRKAGATNLAAGTRYDSEMFGLPTNWRPITNTPLSCTMGNYDPTNPTAGGAVSTAQIEIRTGFLPTEISGRVHYIGGTSALTAGVGWIALQGSFPCSTVDVLDVRIMGSWADAHFQEYWDSLPDNPGGLTWDMYGDPYNYEP
jgi:hypothetical protein